MRVTNNMLINNLKRNLSHNLGKMQTTQNQLATGKRISKPSDDPVGIVDSLRFSTRIRENMQYQENVTDAIGFLSTTETVMGSLNTALTRVYELAIYAANGSMAHEDRQSLKEEVVQIIDEVKSIANTSHGDKYIFGGTNTTAPPYDEGATIPPWNANPDQIKYEIGKGIVMPVNFTAQEVFKDKDLLGTLDGIVAHMGADDTTALGGTDLTLLKENTEQILSCRAQAGARINRLEMTLNRLRDQEINFATLQSEVDDVDIAETIIDLQNQENVYEASLAVGARIIVPSLVNFLS